MVKTIKLIPKRFIWAIIGLTAFLSVAVVQMLGIETLFARNVIARGVSIEGVDVGGLTADEANALLAEHALATDKVTLNLIVEDRQLTVQAHELGICQDIDKAVQTAMILGRNGNWLDRVTERYRLKKEGRRLALETTADEERLTDYLSELAATVNEPARDGFFTLGPNNEMVPVPERPGRTFAIEDAKSQIISSLGRGDYSITLPVLEKTPRTIADLRRLGIKDVVAVFSTRFNSADTGRTHNLKLGTQTLSGRLIETGGLFSFNEVVGPREAEQGYLEAPVIIKDELVPGIGGGICQVSSTLYNAVLLAGLAPIERLNHTLPSSYVALGRDATVAYGAIDFKFKNTRPEPIMIGTRVDNNQLAVAIFGTRRGEKVEIDTLIEEVIPFPIVYTKDETLPPEADNIKQQGQPGYKVKVTRVIRKEGAMVSQELLSRDTYRPTPEIHLVGTAFEPPTPDTATDPPIEDKTDPLSDDLQEEVLLTYD